MNTQMIEALTTATRANISPVICWWNDKEKSDLVNEAVKNGWALRHSVTQVEWTEKGIEEYKRATEKEVATSLPIADGNYILETFTNANGKPCAKLITKRGKTVWNYRFKTEQLRDEYAIEQGERIEKEAEERAEYIAKSKAEQADKIAKLSEGDIFYTSWGYDQTNVDFYRIIKISGKRITVRRLQNRTVETGFMSGNSTPDDAFHPYFTKEVIVGITKYGSFQIDGHYAQVWDGKEKSCSWYA